jgi:tetratricopeptide (TPR) repeat protein
MSHVPQRRVLPGLLVGAGLVVVCSLSGCTMPEVRTAERMAAEGNWDAAVAAYRAAWRKDPYNDEVRQALEAVKSKAGEAHYLQGRQALKEGHLPEALQELTLALSHEPARADYHDAMNEALRLREAREKAQAGDKLRGVGRLEDALQAYEQAVELDPSLAPALQAITSLTQQQRAEKSPCVSKTRV